MKINLKNNIFLLFLAFALCFPYVSSFNIYDELGTGINVTTTISNSTISFDSINIFFDNLELEDSNLTFYNVSFINGNLTINQSNNGALVWNDTNTLIDSSAFMYLSSESTTRYVITSNLTVTTPNITATVENIYSCPKISSISYLSNSSASALNLLSPGLYVCSGTTLQLVIGDVDNGENVISIQYTEPSTGGGGRGDDAYSDSNLTAGDNEILNQVDKYYNRTYLCEQTEYFIKIFGVNYSESDYQDFKNKLTLYFGFPVSDDVLRPFIKEHDKFCTKEKSVDTTTNQDSKEGGPTYIPVIIFAVIIIVVVVLVLIFKINQHKPQGPNITINTKEFP